MKSIESGDSCPGFIALEPSAYIYEPPEEKCSMDDCRAPGKAAGGALTLD